MNDQPKSTPATAGWDAEIEEHDVGAVLLEEVDRLLQSGTHI